VGLSVKRIAIAAAIAAAAAGSAGTSLAKPPRDCGAEATQTSATEQVVRAYAQMVFIEHKTREGLERYVAADLKQHHPNMPDGRAAAEAILVPKAAAWTSQIQRVIAQGCYAVVYQHAFNGPDDHLGRALVDIYRVEHGQIVEHWDISQPVPDAAAASEMF
jgi:predicted SnoaL-like aldol condensation-catalyzing enzyme